MSRRKPITCCPHCGSKQGVFTKTTYVNVPYCIGFDGEEQYNGEMYDNAERHDGGMMAYCQSCGKPVCRLTTMQKQWRGRG
ncbi:hypothetical protein B5E43_11735 [Flavonifractor sp. An100]|nr:hypothetical protein B5E43_11735 [Flavonifractor sp. An100]